eukprot:TRINITY_DN3982_c0_g1_i5.p1 TRINITY_DN3982_c0_g1~~TRINITY_DN3982_c0_g1_i5.p1  ORF type:complete len:416 (+),score=70.70 TRINITY_DN3982_c0_g1_i5:75-1322(+)
MILANYLGIIFVALTPIYIVFIYLLHKQRHERIVFLRSYFLMQAQNVGMLISTYLFGARLIATPFPGCQWDHWTMAVPTTLILVPFLLRCWVFLWRYYITQRRITPLLGSPRVSKALRLISPPAVERFFWVWTLLQFLLIAAVAVALYVVNKDQPQENDLDCPHQSGLQYWWYTYLSILLVAISLVITFVLLWKTKDAYRIKQEIVICLCIWVPFLVLWGIQSQNFRGVVISETVPTVALISVAMYIMFGVSCIWIWHLSRRTLKVGNHLDLASKLQDPIFRAQFAEFLCLQLSIENLLFWEDVEAFKRIPADATNKQDTAQQLYAKYIKEGGAFEINISHANKHEVSSLLKAGNLDSAFDVAQAEVMHLMKFHSYPLFHSSSESGATNASSWSSSERDMEMDSTASAMTTIEVK